MIVTVLDVVIAGLLMGGLYALIAMGLSLQYGVARVLNIAHGEFIMLGALTTWMLYAAFDINPLISLAICGPAAFILGFIIHRTLYRRLLISTASPGIFESNSMLASFGLLFIIQNLALMS
jgi:branched-chain amino acid transport system permease protein